jgi:hypothetical protein
MGSVGVIGHQVVKIFANQLPYATSNRIGRTLIGTDNVPVAVTIPDDSRNRIEDREKIRAGFLKDVNYIETFFATFMKESSGIVYLLFELLNRCFC